MATTIRSFGEATRFVITASGLLRQFRAPNLTLKTVEGESLTTLFGSADLGGAVLRCVNPGQNGRSLDCRQGQKDSFYVCPAQEDGSTVRFGNAALAGASEGCQVLALETYSTCEQ